MEASAEAFVLAATGRQRTRAEALLAARPELVDDPWAALALGRAWRGDPSTPGGPRGWAPLFYVCHSCFPSAALAQELLALEPGELVVGVALPATPDASAYERLGERAAFSFPLVSVAAVRRGTETRLVAAGVANIPRELDAADPLAGLPGNPQTGWKRRALETLVERATAAVA